MTPEKWSRTNLKEIIDGPIRNGYSPVATDVRTGYWVLGLGALGESNINSSEIKSVTPETKVLQSILKADDFLVSRSNTPSKVGRSIRFKGEIENCSYPDLMMRFRINESEADLIYIEQLLKSKSTRSYFSRNSAGSSSTMVKINKGVLEKTPILLPPLREQRKIAKILQIWDRAIATTEKLIDASKQQKKALMQQLLTGKKRFAGFEGKGLKKTIHGPIPADWRYLSISEVADQYSEKNVRDEAYPVVSCSKHVGFVDSLQYFKKKVYSEDLTGYKLIPKGYFGFPSNHIEEGSIGCQYEHEIGLVSPIYTVFKPKDDIVDSRFLISVLKTDQYRQIFSAATNASVDRRGSLRWKEFSLIKIALPNIKEQKRISSAITATEKQTSILSTKLIQLKQEKKALMQQLLTGKRRVKVDD